MNSALNERLEDIVSELSFDEAKRKLAPGEKMVFGKVRKLRKPGAPSPGKKARGAGGRFVRGTTRKPAPKQKKPKAQPPAKGWALVKQGASQVSAALRKLRGVSEKKAGNP